MRLAPFVLALLLTAPLALALSPPSEPTAPGALQGAAVGTIELSWTAPNATGASPIGGYRIYRSVTPLGLSHHLDVGNILSFTDTGIPDGAPRYYRFSAVNGDGEGPLSPVVNASARAPPTVPRTVTGAPLSRGNVTITWLAPQYNGSADITSYNVYRSATENGTYSLLASPTVPRFNDTGHGDNVTLWYRVSGVNVYGEGPLSAPRSARTPTLPGVPEQVTTTTTPGLGIEIDWDRPTDTGGTPITLYRIFRTVGSDPEKGWATVLGSTTLATDRSCPLTFTCSYRVHAVNAIGTGPFSDPRPAMGDSVFALRDRMV